MEKLPIENGRERYLCVERHFKVKVPNESNLFFSKRLFCGTFLVLLQGVECVTRIVPEIEFRQKRVHNGLLLTFSRLQHSSGVSNQQGRSYDNAIGDELKGINVFHTINGEEKFNFFCRFIPEIPVSVTSLAYNVCHPYMCLQFD